MTAYMVYLGDYDVNDNLICRADRLKFFFDKKEAEAFCNENIREYKVTAIYETLKNGEVLKSTIGWHFYEEYLKNARPNEKVVLETVTESLYNIKKIEIE